MNINPLKLLELKNMRDQFAANHPKFPRFIEAVTREALVEGSVIEIQVAMPDGRKLVTNLKLTASDIQMLQSLQELSE